MPRNVKKTKPLTISSSYESYCRERKAARSRSVVQASSGHDDGSDDRRQQQQPLIEIQSCDDDDPHLDESRDDNAKKEKWNRRLMTPDTIPTTASWSVSSKTIVNSWYQPASVGTTETTKTISSYVSNKGVFSPLYEVNSEHVNVYEQSGLPLPKPGQTPRFGKLTYKKEKSGSGTGDANDDRVDSADGPRQTDTPTVSSRQVREKWQQLQDKTDQLLGPLTPVAAASAMSTSSRRVVTTNCSMTYRKSQVDDAAPRAATAPSIPTSPVRTFESYMKGEWRLGSSAENPSTSIESDLSLDPIVQVKDLKNAGSVYNPQPIEPCRPRRDHDGLGRGSNVVSESCSNVCENETISDQYHNRRRRADTPEGGDVTDVVIDEKRCNIGADSGVEIELSGAETHCIASTGFGRQNTEPTHKHHADRQVDQVMKKDTSENDVVDVALLSDRDLGSAKLPLHLEQQMYSSYRSDDDELSQGTKDALIPPNLFEKTQSIFGSSSWPSPHKKEGTSKTANNILIDVTSISHNQSEDDLQANSEVQLRSTPRTSTVNNASNLNEHNISEQQLMATYAPSAEQIYQSMLERNIKQQRRLTPKASKAITIDMDEEDLKPIVYLSRQFTQHANEGVYRSGVALVASPTTSDFTFEDVPYWKQQKRNFDVKSFHFESSSEKPCKDRLDRVAVPDENRCTVRRREDPIITDLTDAISPGHCERYPLKIGSIDLDIPDLNAICLRATASDFESVDIHDDELRAVMQITNDGENASVIFPTFSCDTIAENFSDDGLSYEVSALTRMQEELESCMQAANSVSPRSMPLLLNSPSVYESSGDSSMADLRGVCRSSSEKSRSVKSSRDSLPFAKKVQFKDDIQELLYVHEIGSFEDQPTPPKRSFLDRFFSSFDDLIDDMGNACISCSGKPRKPRNSSRRKYPDRMEV